MPGESGCAEKRNAAPEIEPHSGKFDQRRQYGSVDQEGSGTDRAE
jgi:hypothetical protein